MPSGSSPWLSILVCTHGAPRWAKMAMDRAYPSAANQGAVVITMHDLTASLAQVRNRAAERATTPWLCFLDADDELDPGFAGAMEVQAPWLTPGAEIGGIPVDSPPRLLVPAVSYMRMRGGRWVAGRSRMLTSSLPLSEMNVAVIGTLVPRWLFHAVGGFREWPAYEDWDLWLRCVAHGADLYGVPDAVYRVYPGGRNSQPREVLDRAWREIRKANGYA